MAAQDRQGEPIYRFLECTAGEYMTANVIPRHMKVRELEALFATHDFNSFPVVENGKLLGIVTKFDFLRNFAFTTDQILPRYSELMGRKVADMMTEAVVDVDPSTPLTRVLQLMITMRGRSLPVVERGGRLVGMISREDIMRALGTAAKPA
jgi:CBS domain-containing protein